MKLEIEACLVAEVSRRNRQTLRRRFLGWVGLQVEHHLKEWLPARIAFRLQLLDEFFERHILMVIGAKGHFFHSFEQVAKTWISR